MRIVEALQILKLHNEWRRGADTPMPDPDLIGEARDTVLSHLDLVGSDVAFAVIPDAERLDIGENSVVAVFKYRYQAEIFATKLWDEHYIIKEIDTHLFVK